MSDFFAMGGYGIYIWPCYGIALVVLLAVLTDSLRAARSRKKMLEKLKDQNEKPDHETQT